MSRFVNGLTKYLKGSPSQKPWLDLQFHDSKKTIIKKPAELEKDMKEPPKDSIDPNILDKIQGSIIGMALGDALGAHVEFRPHQYLFENPVSDLEGGGTWGLQKGQFTDDTSMALCLANSLVSNCEFNPYDQLVRYKWWWRKGYMSSTGECFDIGAATSQALSEFERRQNNFCTQFKISSNKIDYIRGPHPFEDFNVYCSDDGVAGNGALMRLAPVPLFFFRHPAIAVEYSGISGQITHGDVKAYDACRYYGALIVAAVNGCPKNLLLSADFYSKHRPWFGDKPLCSDIQKIVEGSYQKKGGYDEGIRGKGYIVDALEAALWAFWSDQDSFEKGALNAVNLGDDTDTTAAIYGQLAGAHYGYKNLPKKWLKHVYAHKFMLNLCQWIVYEGQYLQPSDSLHEICETHTETVTNDSDKKQLPPKTVPNSQQNKTTTSKINSKSTTANSSKPPTAVKQSSSHAVHQSTVTKPTQSTGDMKQNSSIRPPNAKQLSTEPIAPTNRVQSASRAAGKLVNLASNSMQIRNSSQATPTAKSTELYHLTTVKEEKSKQKAAEPVKGSNSRATQQKKLLPPSNIQKKAKASADLKKN